MKALEIVDDDRHEGYHFAILREMFSPNGRKLLFASNRNAAREGETAVFVANWAK